MDENPHVRLSVASVELPDGKQFEQYVFRMRRCVMTVVLDEPGEHLLLIWRHRFIVDRWDWEVPGGYVDPGEDGAAAAVREVEEETGWRPRAVDFLLTFQPTLGSADAPRERFSEINPGEVTGYAVSLRGHTGTDRTPRWYGGGRLHDSLTLPRLRARWTGAEGGAAGRSGAFRITAPERPDIYRHAARQAAIAAEHLRRCAAGDPGSGADAAWAVADALHAAARATGSRVLGCAADGYDRAARAPHRRIPRRTREGDGLRTAARLLAMTGDGGGGGMGQAGSLARNLVSLVDAVAELRVAQAHAAQAAAARQTAEQMYAAFDQARARVPRAGGARAPAARPGSRADAEFPVPVTEVLAADPAHQAAGVGSSPRVAQPPVRARPAR